MSISFCPTYWIDQDILIEPPTEKVIDTFLKDHH